MPRLPGPAPGVWHGAFPAGWRSLFTSMAWADLAAQVMAMDSPAGPPLGIPAPGGAPARARPVGPLARQPGGSAGGGGEQPPGDRFTGGDEALGPIGTRLMVANDLVNIWEVALAPGEQQPWHRHAYPYVVVVLEDSRSEITDQYGQIHAPGAGAGTVVFDPGGAVHKLQNVGDGRLRDRLIEFKLPLTADLLREIAA
jgi:hypothetical protein